MTRKALGRGLGALLSADTNRSANDVQSEIEIDLIDPSPVQPRSRFNEAKLIELAQSITANGVVQPLLVRRRGTRYELVAGERRWRAAQMAGLTHVPVVVRSVPDEKLLELALIENIQREDLNPIEEAQAYQRLIETLGLTQEELAERVGRDRSYVTNFLRLLRLPAEIQWLVEEGKLSTGHARTLLAVSAAEDQLRLARKIIEHELSVRDTERIVHRADGKRQASSSRDKGKSDDPNVRAAENRLRRQLGTKVRILMNLQGSGKIEIEFYTEEDLDRLYRLLLPAAAAGN